MYRSGIILFALAILPGASLEAACIREPVIAYPYGMAGVPAGGHAAILWLGMGGLVLGTLAVFPYLVIASWHLPRWRWISEFVVDVPGLGAVVFFSAFFLGLPLGIAAIVLVVLSWRRSPRSRAGLIFAVIGILLGIAGAYGHYWFFATCQFCQ